MRLRTRGGGASLESYGDIKPGRSCFSGVYLKFRYPSAEEAGSRLKAGEAHYACPDCNGWHKTTVKQ